MSTVFAEFSGVDVVVTPNLRLRRYLENALADCLPAETMPRVLAMREWVTELYLSAMVTGSIPALSIADAGRAYAIMSAAADADGAADQVVGRRALVDTALTAASIADLWMVNWTELGGSVEADMFARWLRVRNAQYEQHGLISFEVAVSVVARAISVGVVRGVGSNIILYAFDDLAPAYDMLVKTIMATGATVQNLGDLHAADTVQSVGVAKKQDQYITAARWAMAHLAQNPQARIGIVCPELASDREQVLDAFARVFEPEFLDPSVARYTLPFNISAGVQLSVVPVIRTALEILAMRGRKMPVEALSAVMLSPFIGGSVQEMNARMVFDSVMRGRIAGTASWMDVLSFAKGIDGLAMQIASYSKLSVGVSGKLRPSQWAIHFSQLLEAIGWPGERELDSQEYQAVSHWNAQLDALASLDGILVSCSVGEAMDLLSRLCARTVFQPETCDSPIQILGVLEAAGLGFDHVWITDMNDDVWPQVSKPNPFLPYAMQRDLLMPHGSAERELSYSQAILARLLGCTPDVVLSYATACDDRELRRSPLLDGIADVSVSALVMADYVRHTDAGAAAFTLDSRVDAVAPFAKDGVVAVHGGVGVLEAQAKCPFQAAAKYRLGAVAPRPSTQGLSYAERGTLLHDVLEFFWKNAKSQAELIALGDHGIGDLIDTSIAAGFTRLRSRRADIGLRLFSMERDRLRELMTEWVAVELAREPFRVQSTEAADEVVIGNLKMRVRRDRVDELADGRAVSVEYKTGAFGLNRWGGQRPESSQTPIYVSSDRQTAGAVIALVKKGESKLMGYSAETGIIASDVKTPEKNRYGLPENWNDLGDFWAASMEQLADEYCSGRITIDPKSFDTCRRCELSSICRIANS